MLREPGGWKHFGAPKPARFLEPRPPVWTTALGRPEAASGQLKSTQLTFRLEGSGPSPRAGLQAQALRDVSSTTQRPQTRQDRTESARRPLPFSNDAKSQIGNRLRQHFLQGTQHCIHLCDKGTSLLCHCGSERVTYMLPRGIPLP